MKKDYPHLFSPITIRNTTFRNRIIMAPFLPQNADEDGMPTEFGITYYERRARGGAAQLTVGESPVDTDRACRKYGGYLDLTRDEYPIRNICMMSELTMMMHQHNTVAGIELCHVGMWNHPRFTKDHKNPVGPVAQMRPDGVKVDALDPEMMNEIAGNFARAARNAKEFGFDSVMIHGGHGWLQSQFLSPLTNTRTDEYGGSLENRARFPIQIVDAVREAVGEDTLIEYRISATELVEGGISLEESIAFLQMIEDKIDLVHVSVGCYQNPVITRTFPSIYEEYGCNADLAAEIKKNVHIPVAVVGVINTPEKAEEIIAEGKADFVAIAKQLIADPDFALKAAYDTSDEIVPCIRCYRCMGEPGACPNVLCTVNPMAAREAREPYLRPRSLGRHVLVAGGGPGGMKAAVTAAQAGHRVTLLEASDELGGAIRFSQYDPHKKDLNRFLRYLIRQVYKTPGIEVRLNTKAVPETVSDLKPDVLIAAIGAQPNRPRFPGMEETDCITAMDAYRTDPGQLGKNIVIVGGGLVGCELAIHLRDCGKNVTIAEMGAAAAPDCVLFPRMALEEQLKNGITLLLNTKVQAVSHSGVETDRGFLEADQIILACGMHALAEDAQALCAQSAQSVRIGDCVKPRKMLSAIHEGYFAALDIY